MKRATMKEKYILTIKLVRRRSLSHQFINGKSKILGKKVRERERENEKKTYETKITQ
jgi:hypothetical protein